MTLSYEEAVEFLKTWEKDINYISVKGYDGIIELLINGHYLLSIRM